MEDNGKLAVDYRSSQIRMFWARADFNLQPD